MKPTKALTLTTGVIAAAWMLTAAAPASQLAPLHLTTVTGSKLMLGGERKVIIIHYWATWCAPCRIEMPVLDSAYKRYHGSGLETVGVALDAGASRAKIAQAGGVSFPLARVGDTSVEPSQVPRALPETLVYGRDGRLRYAFRAGKETLDAAALERILPALLAER